MRYVMIALALAGILAGVPTQAQACTYSTSTYTLPDGRLVICTTTCCNGFCNTFCN